DQPVIAVARVDPLLPGRPGIDDAGAAAGADRAPRLVPYRLAVPAVGGRPVGRVEGAGGGERDVAGRVPCPAVLQLGPAERHDERGARRPPYRRGGECAGFLVLLADAQASEGA